MASNSKKTETLVGLFLFIGFVLLGGIILLFGNIGDFFKGSYEIKVSFTEAPGIIKGSTVRLRGAKVGEVAGKPMLTGDSMIEVVLDIDDRFQIDQGSVFQIGQASLLGDKEIVITSPAHSSHLYLNPGAEVLGSDPGGLELLQNEAEGIAVDARALLKDAKGTLVKLEDSMEEIRVVLAKMGTTMDTVNEGVLTEKNVGAFGNTLANLDRASATFADLGERLDPAVSEFRLAINEVRATNASAKETIETAKETMETAKGAIARVDPALEGVPRVLDSIEKTADRATAAIDKVDSKKGALGALVSDQELKTDMKDFVRNLKKNGVLRYKDEDEKEEDPRDRYQGRRR
jgi:phospholipid/cholesterol/gamma-HCH transport system substrate-binding protein